MKKVLLLALPILMMASCGNREAEKAAEDSARMADSIAKVEEARQKAEQARIDSIRQDSLMQIEIDSLYKNGLVLNKGKQSKKWVGDQTDPNITAPITLTNNTNFTLYPEDYVVSYTYELVVQTPDGYLDFANRSKTKKGPQISPGESANMQIYHECILDIRNIKVKLKISKEEFAKRYREAKASR